MADTALLRMEHVSKSFPGVQALDDVSLDVGGGEVLGLVGENGAGKSTLMKILSGVYQAESGTVTLDGQDVHIHNPHQGQRLGISIIYQEFNLMPNLSVMENIFVGRETGRFGFVNRGELRKQTRVLLDRLGVRLNPNSIVRDLSVAEQQMVEIAKALSMQVKVLIMDEPTSALSETEVDQLLSIIRDLKRDGIGVIFISHRLEEVLTICDRISVLRDGRNVGTIDAHGATEDIIIQMMVGRSRSELFHSEERFEAEATTSVPDDVVLEVRGLSRQGTVMDEAAIVLDDVSFTLRRGEILGMAGLVGAGRTEAVRAIFGADKFDHGEVLIDGKPVTIESPIDAINYGIGFVPEDRKAQGLVLSLNVRDNAALPSLHQISRLGFVRRGLEEQAVTEYAQRLQIRTPSLEQLVLRLSGGNQQKVVIAKWLMRKPRILIMDEPTRGIDVGAKAEIYRLMNQLAESGVSIIMISSELPEVLAMSDRIVCMSRGRVTAILNHTEATPEVVMRYCTLQPGQTIASPISEGGIAEITASSAPPQRAETGEGRQRSDPLTVMSRFGAFVFLIVLCVVFTILEPAFVSTTNIFNVLRQVSIYGLLAIGMTFVILTGGIDLSIGSLLALSGLVGAAVYKGGTGLLSAGTAGQAHGYGLWAAVGAAVLVGLTGGFLQGFAVSKLRVPAFIVTLGGLSIFRGMSLVFTQGQPISTFPVEYSWWGQGLIGPVPIPVIIFLMFAVIASIILRNSRYGRHIYAIGGNQEASRLSGLNVSRLLLSVYMITGFFAGLSGFLLSSRLNSAEVIAGVGYELTVIAGVVIGGTSLFGGEGSIFGTVVGVVLIGVLNNGLTLIDVSPYYQQIIIGFIIILAVYLDQLVKRRRR